MINWWIPNRKFSAFCRTHADVICFYSLFSALHWAHYTMKNGRSVSVLRSGLYHKNGWISDTTAVSKEDQSIWYGIKTCWTCTCLTEFPSLQLFSLLTPHESKVVSLYWCFIDLHEFAYLLLSFSLITSLNGNINVSWHVAINHVVWRTTNGNSREASLCPVHQYLVQIFQ